MRSFEEICSEEGFSVTPEIIRADTSSLFLPRTRAISIWESDNSWEFSDPYVEPNEGWPWQIGILAGTVWLLAGTKSAEGWPWWTAIAVGLSAGSILRLIANFVEHHLPNKAVKEGKTKHHSLHCGTEENSIELFRSESLKEVRLVRAEVEKIMLESKGL